MYRPPPANAPGFQGSPPMSPSSAASSPWQRPPPGAESMTPPSQLWREHQNPEGRKYWFNTVTRQSTWEKPEELLTPEEKALMNCPWKEYKTPEGKTYYSNSQTKESKWVMPDEYKELYEKAEKAKERAKEFQQAAPPVPMAVRPEMDTRRQIRQPPPSATLLSQVPVVEFSTKEEAEKAFYKLLKETGVRPDWTWEQTMREIITHPMYRALKTPGERKAAFQLYVDKEAKREREIREEKETKQRVAFFHMLENTKEIKPYTRYRTVAKLLGHQSAFTQIKSDSQRETYFDEYVHGLQRREKDRLRELRKSNMENFAELLRQIPEITYETKWKDAQSLYMKHPQFEDPRAFEAMDMLDFLSVYEEHSRMLWDAPLEDLNRKMRERRRAERKAREGFRSLLNELYRNGSITVRTLWKEVYPEIKNDPRYTNLLGVPESTPFDLFCDLLDDLDEKLYQDKRLIYDALKDNAFEVTLDTSFDEYHAVVAKTRRPLNEQAKPNVKIIFEHLQNKAAHRVKEEKRRQEKKIKKKIDALRHAMKYLDPAVSVEDSWEAVRPRIENLAEYQAIETDQQRMEAYEKFIKRLKEKHAEQDDEDEEGMIKEDDEANYTKHHAREHMHRRYKQYPRRGSDRESDHGFSDEERSRRRKKRHMPSHHDSFDNPIDGNRSSAEEGEALDEYENAMRRLH